ncbi:hypothetical protein DFQ01_1424 [Paenibacillus cellulosilyticus]|uniref:Sporulation membrane protein YtrI C-terminal domain-containing protein n=1 Tax=Paenibacillus cellulosilyticus TaxID=375489 RepID=A0A2V2YE43_9BACL|nr:hypothetical protein [Paenibacillus cellulosilyticus]PWV90556.1 hypothetical protein DFQ01_1424 [Paenibacillus cellulosilyticus]QKS46762.1 hypothetical protein HUB94_19870 [Paenibacillus cellulosilyticus]
MRVPPFERYYRYVRYSVVLLLGSVIGAAVYHSIFMNNFNTVVRLNGQLKEQLEQSGRDIDDLKKLQHQHTVIKSIVPYIEDEDKPLNVLVETELKKRLKEDLSVFIGKSIYSIDENADMARTLLKNKLYAGIRGADYRVSILTVLVVDNVLQVWARATVYERPPA